MKRIWLSSLFCLILLCSGCVAKQEADAYNKQLAAETTPVVQPKRQLTHIDVNDLSLVCINGFVYIEFNGLTPLLSHPGLGATNGYFTTCEEFTK